MAEIAVGALVTVMVGETVIGTSVARVLDNNGFACVSLVSTFLLIEEGRTWVRGWHDPTTPEGRALIVCGALKEKPDSLSSLSGMVKSFGMMKSFLNKRYGTGL